MGFTVPSTILKLKSGQVDCSPFAYLMRSSENVIASACSEDMGAKKMEATFKKWVKFVLVHEFTITSDDADPETFTETMAHYWKKPETIRGYGYDEKKFNRRKASKTDNGTKRGKHKSNGLYLVKLVDGVGKREDWERIDLNKREPANG